MMTDKNVKKDVSQRLADKMLQGWTLLGSHCPENNCSTPFMRNRNGKMWCVNCEKWAMTEEELEKQNKEINENNNKVIENDRNMNNSITNDHDPVVIDKENIILKKELDEDAHKIKNIEILQMNTNHSIDLCETTINENNKNILKDSMNTLYKKLEDTNEKLKNTKNSPDIIRYSRVIYELATSINQLKSLA